MGTKENKTDLSCSARNLIDSESVKNELIASAFSQPLVKRKNSSKEGGYVHKFKAVYIDLYL